MESQLGDMSLEDEEWQRSEGIPLFSDQFIQKYYQGRDALIAQEDKHRSDRDFREMMSPMAMEASAIVSQIRFEEQQTIWTDQLEDDMAKKSGGELYPGMMFSLAKERMEQTKLWKIVRRMPKGALLHCHLDAMIDQHWLFNEALETEGIHIGASGSLASATDRETQFVHFRYRKTSPASEASLWSGKCKEGTLVPIKEAAESFPDGGKEGFIDWLVSRCSISAEESLHHHHGPNSIWKKFGDCFQMLESITHYESIYRKLLARMFGQLVDDGCRWVDVRSTFAFKYYKQDSEEPEEGIDEVIRVFGEEVKKFQATEKGRSFWGARMIWTTLRFFDDRKIVESMKDCIRLKVEYPDLISGFDLVGQEDAGRPLADLTPLLFWFRKRCAEAGVTIPFFFHAGETLGTGTETDLNLFDAILLGTRRLGHAFSIYKHPLLMNMVRDKRLLVECCPVSNEVLRLTSSIMSHPLPALLAQGVPVALCNDDPGILGQGVAGMSHDFWQALQGFENLGLEGLGALAENSVRWSAFEDMEAREWTEDVKNGAFGHGIKARRMKEWKREWEKFCQWIVMEFGVDENFEDDDGEEPEPKHGDDDVDLTEV